jgi:hypothetical protein
MAIVSIKGLLLDQLEQQLELPPNAQMGHDVGPELLKWDEERKAEADSGSLKRALIASAGVSINLLNSVSDADIDGVFGAAKDAADDAGVVPQPRLYPDAGTWLKYRVGANLRIEASNDLGLATITGEFGRSVQYAAYLHHGSDERVVDAIARDLRSLPSALDVGDIAALGTGDAVVVQLPGKLALSLALDESLLASTSLRPIASEFGLVGPLALEIKSGFSFSAALELTDDVRLCFVGLGDGRTFVSLRKADATDVALKLGASVSVGFDKATQDKLTELYSVALIGDSVARIEALLAKADPAALSHGDQNLLAQLAERLGISGTIAQKLTDVRTRLDQWRERLTKRVKEVVSTRIELGFAFEYSRVASSGSLLECEIDADTLRELHPSLLRFDLGPTLALALAEEGKPEDERRLKKFFYLHERRVLRTASRGITLGIGKWFNLSARLYGTRQRVEQTDASQSRKRYAWVSVNGVTGALNGVKAGSSLTFRAETVAFQQDARMRDLTLGLSVAAVQEKVRNDKLPELLDAAAIWGVLPATDLEQSLAMLRSRLGKDVEPDATLSLSVSDPIVRLFAQYLSEHTNRQLAPVLARALPYWARYEGRTNIAIRERIYTPVFEEFVEYAGGLNYRPELRVRAMLSAEHLKLAVAEARPNRPMNRAFTGYATEKDGIGRNAIGMRLDCLRSAFDDLMREPHAPVTNMDGILNTLYASNRTFAERSFTVRVFGALLAEVARASQRPDDWQAELTFEWEDADGKKSTLSLQTGHQ